MDKEEWTDDKYISYLGHQFVRQLNFDRIISSKLNPLKVSFYRSYQIILFLISDLFTINCRNVCGYYKVSYRHGYTLSQCPLTVNMKLYFVTQFLNKTNDSCCQWQPHLTNLVPLFRPLFLRLCFLLILIIWKGQRFYLVMT